MATTRNRPKTTNISKSAIDQVGSLLQDLSAKPREEMSLREAIDQLREPIQNAMARGYSYEDIVKILAEKGIPTTVTTVKRYISLGNSPKRKVAGKTRTKRGRKTEADQFDEAPEPATASKSESDPEPAPTRGRRKAADSSTSVEAEATPAKGRAKSSRAATPKTPGRGRKKAV